MPPKAQVPERGCSFHLGTLKLLFSTSCSVKKQPPTTEPKKKKKTTTKLIPETHQKKTTNHYRLNCYCRTKCKHCLKQVKQTYTYNNNYLPLPNKVTFNIKTCSVTILDAHNTTPCAVFFRYTGATAVNQAVS